MISLMMSSSSSPCIGRRNVGVNSKVIAGASQNGTPADGQASESEEEGALSGHLLVRSIVLLAIFRRGLLGPVKLQESSRP